MPLANNVAIIVFLFICAVPTLIVLYDNDNLYQYYTLAIFQFLVNLLKFLVIIRHDTAIRYPYSYEKFTLINVSLT
ncbi:hypothetical protein GCM10007425_11770 [Lysinibacillus alkalisoli]|uniref:Uncharacterized protein n=1 Tax=Lysinibacillus alkalisoli TaxID=1911548 RepID=A0A917G200_9BACI|nr:hypothetical protein GCM10007425_11770 [Lysinibacillus alkalisoli]